MNTIFSIGSNFKGIIDVLGTFSDTATFYYDIDNIIIQTCDYSNISMLSLKLYMDQFISHKVDKPGFFSFNLKSMKPALKSMKDDDTVNVIYTEKLKLVISNNDRTNTYDIYTIDCDDDKRDVDIPMEHDILLTMDKLVLNRVLNDIKYVESDCVEFKVDTENKLTIITKSDDCSLKIQSENIVCVNQSSEIISVLFANRYIQLIQKMLPICINRGIIKFDSKLPFIFESKIKSGLVDVTKTESKLTFFLAPKVLD